MAARSSLRHARERLGRTLTASRLATVDQLLISAGNFATMIVLARLLAPTDFGVYAFVNFVFISALVLQYGLTLQPFLIEGAGLDDRSFGSFLRAHAVLQFGLIGLSTAVVGSVSLLWEPLRPHLLPLVLAVALLHGQDFCRRALYCRGRVRAAMASNVINSDLQPLLLLLVGVTFGLTLDRALWIVAGTSLAALIVAAAGLGPFWAGATAGVGTVLRGTIRLGRWTAGAAALQEFSAQGLLALVTSTAGLVGSAGLGVIAQILGPAQMLARPLQNYHLARAVETFRQDGESGLRRAVWEAARAIGPLFLLYLSLLAVAPGLVLGLVYGPSHVGHADALRVFALAVVLRLPLYVLQLELHARRMQPQMTAAEIAATATLFAGGFYFIPGMGLLGAGIAVTLAYAVQSTLVGLLVLHARWSATRADTRPVAG